MRQQILSRQDVTAVVVGFSLIVVVSSFFLLRGSFEDSKKTQSASDQSGTAKKVLLPFVAVLDLRTLLVTDAAAIRVVDLRTDSDFRLAHVVGSVLATSPDAVSAVSLPSGGTLVLIPSGNDDINQAVQEDLSKGERKFAFLKNGLSDWVSAGGTIVTEPNFSSAIDRSKVTFIKPVAWNDMIAKKDIRYRILDVRPSFESSKSAIVGALNIPFDELENRRAELPIASNIALCAGNTDDAYRGAIRLFDLGFFSVKTLDGACSDIAVK